MNTLVKSVPSSNAVNHSLVLFKEDTSPINTYIKLVTAFSCYFHFPVRKSLDQTSVVIKSLLKRCFCMHMCTCIHICMSVCVSIPLIIELITAFTEKDPEIIT